MAITIVRPALICGENAPGNIQRLLKLVSKNLPLPFKNVKNKRALVSLDNVVSFINECVVNEKAKNQLFLLADAERPSTEEMIETFAAGMDIKAKIIYFPKSIMKLLLSGAGKGGIYDQLFGDLEVDASKSREHLHWTPPITLHETMKKRRNIILKVINNVEFWNCDIRFLASCALTWGLRGYAIKHNVIDRPNQRSSHSVPTPRGGGVAIVLTLLGRFGRILF